MPALLPDERSCIPTPVCHLHVPMRRVHSGPRVHACVYAFSLAFAGHVLSHVVSTQRLAK